MGNVKSGGRTCYDLFGSSKPSGFGRPFDQSLHGKVSENDISEENAIGNVVMMKHEQKLPVERTNLAGPQYETME